MWDLWNKVSALAGFELASEDVPKDILDAQNIEHFLSHIQAKLSLRSEDSKLSDFLAFSALCKRRAPARSNGSARFGRSYRLGGASPVVFRIRTSEAASSGLIFRAKGL
jgi:hypothetical protein